MHGLGSRDGDNVIDWGKTSEDYSVHRPGPPRSFFARLAALGIGLKGQRILDLGTGTGVMARHFAREGAVVQGIDISAEQLAMADQLAKTEGLQVEFSVHSAESLPWTEPKFDVATANQCWLYFDNRKVLSELRRVLRPGGLLVTSHFSWLPRLDEIARRSEQLILQFNPKWSGADYSGEIPPCPKWAEQVCDVTAMFSYDEPIPFTRETWCGRIRACRGIGATLSPREVEAFDAAHRELLRRTVPESFSVLHRLDAHLFALKTVSSCPESPPLTWREGTSSDIEQLAEWNHQLIRDEGHRNRMTVPQLGERLRGWLEQDYRALVFELAGIPVAYALFREQPQEIYLRQLFVVRERRRQGIGRQAVELLRTNVWPANRRLTVEVLTANTAAVAFWRSVGYVDYSLMLEIVPPS